MYYEPNFYSFIFPIFFPFKKNHLRIFHFFRTGEKKKKNCHMAFSEHYDRLLSNFEVGSISSSLGMKC